MKRSLWFLGMAFAAGPAMFGGTILSLSPAGGAVSALPGGITGWGFTLSNDTDYAVVDNATLIVAADAPGTFTDFISSPSTFTVIGDGPYAQMMWTEDFDAAAQTGLGKFVVDSGASPGDSFSGAVRVYYDLYRISPLDPGFNPDVDWLSTGNFTTAAVSIAVVGAAAAPEPESRVLIGIGLVLGGLYRRWRVGSIRNRAAGN
jgi:hypothetical protein